MANNLKPENRVTLANLNTGEFWIAMYNPTEFEEQVDVNWNAINVVGLSHQPLQYGGTGNWRFSLELFVLSDTRLFESISNTTQIRNFLMSLAYPVAATSVSEGGPPRVCVSWPNLMTLTCVVQSIKFSNSRFNYEGYPVEWTASIDFEEIRDTRITSQKIRQDGTSRSES